MAQTSGPWTPADPEDPQAPGEVLTQDVWELMLQDLVDGVIGTPGSSAYGATASGTRGVSHAAGTALARAHWHKSTGAEVLTSAANAGTLARVDRSVLRVDRSAKSVTLHLVEGTVGAGEPVLSDDGTVTDRPLWAWTITPGAATITGLVDQRQWLGSLVRPCTSTNRPTPARRGMLAVEADTDQLIRYDGTAWVVLLGDSGWQPCPIAFPANWSNQSPTGQRARRLNGAVYYEVNVRREGSDLVTNTADNAGGSHIVTLPEGMRPSQVLSHAVTLSNGIVARLRIYPSGEIYLQVPTQTVTVGRFVRQAGSFVIG